MEPSESTIDPKPFLDHEKMAEMWEGRGMRFACDELFEFCKARGLHPHVQITTFRRMVHNLFERFAVHGEYQRNPREIPPTLFKD